MNLRLFQNIVSLVLVGIVCLTLQLPAFAMSNASVDAQYKENNCTVKDIAKLENGDGKKLSVKKNSQEPNSVLSNVSSIFPENSRQTTHGYGKEINGKKQQPLFQNSYNKKFETNQILSLSSNDHSAPTSREWLNMASTSLKVAWHGRTDRQSRQKRKVKKESVTDYFKRLDSETRTWNYEYINGFHLFLTERNSRVQLACMVYIKNPNRIYEKITDFLGIRIKKQDFGRKKFKTIFLINRYGEKRWLNHWKDTTEQGNGSFFRMGPKGIDAVKLDLTKRNCSREEGKYRCITYLKVKRRNWVHQFEKTTDIKLDTCKGWRPKELRRIYKEKYETWKDSYSINHYSQLAKQGKWNEREGIKFKKKIIFKSGTKTKTSKGKKHLVLDCGLQVKENNHSKNEFIMIEIKHYGQKHYKPIVGLDRNGSRIWSRSMNWVQKYPHGNETSVKGKRDPRGVYWMELLIPLQNCTKERGTYRCSLYVTDPGKTYNWKYVKRKTKKWKYEKKIDIKNIDCEDLKRRRRRIVIRRIRKEKREKTVNMAVMISSVLLIVIGVIIWVLSPYEVMEVKRRNPPGFEA